jgi:ADP-heptose:LPS heptosyltransferase
VVEPLPEGQAPGPDLGWAIAASGRELPPLEARLGIKPPYALLAPGASPGRPRKRWPVQGFAELARALEQMRLTPVVIGGPQEAELGRAIAEAAPSTVVAAGRTKLVDLAALGARAALVVGNDTGPTYMAALAGAPTLILFSADSDPALCAPRGERIRVLRSEDLADLDATAVIKASRVLLGCA